MPKNISSYELWVVEGYKDVYNYEYMNKDLIYLINNKKGEQEFSFF